MGSDGTIGESEPSDGVRFVHLLFAPTSACSLRCAYCYLDDDSKTAHENGRARQTHLPDTLDARATSDAPGTRATSDAPGMLATHDAHRAPAPDVPGTPASGTPVPPSSPLSVLQAAVEKLRAANVVPFNISLHGGEVTCLPPAEFESLVAYIARYYADNAELLRQAGFKPGTPHIKTNLYALDRHLDAIARWNVSVSGSLDVPFSLHERYRRTADGRPTLDKILANVELMRSLPNRKKVSATLFREHVERADELVRDIWRLHRETCLDMNDFNLMVGFADEHCPLTPLSPDEQAGLYRRLHAEFDGTELDAGVNGAWFAEFTPAYCTGCDNCGERFLLLDAQGDVWSCVRGQGHEAFHYGNLLEDSVEDVLRTARTKIFLAHNARPLPEECTACPWLYLCKTGCPFVKRLESSGKSYTCRLQQEIYRANPALYPPSPNPRADARRYAAKMRPTQASSLRDESRVILPGDGIPPLRDIIAADPRIAGVFDADAFRLEVDGVAYRMEPQVLRETREIVSIARDSTVALYARKDILEQACRWPVNNSVYLMLLSGDTVAYGDEGRTKQAHVATLQTFLPALQARPSDDDACYRLDLGPFLAAYFDDLSRERPNNLFATTSALRDAHYAKHKDNAHYHIQTINLPFPNIELVLDDGEENAGRDDAPPTADATDPGASGRDEGKDGTTEPRSPNGEATNEGEGGNADCDGEGGNGEDDARPNEQPPSKLPPPDTKGAERP